MFMLNQSFGIIKEIKTYIKLLIIKDPEDVELIVVLAQAMLEDLDLVFSSSFFKGRVAPS